MKSSAHRFVILGFVIALLSTAAPISAFGQPDHTTQKITLQQDANNPLAGFYHFRKSPSGFLLEKFRTSVSDTPSPGLDPSVVQPLTSFEYGEAYFVKAQRISADGAFPLAGVADAPGYQYKAHFPIRKIVSVPPSQPRVSITAPASGAIVAGSVNVTASASDNVGVTAVQFLLDGAVLGAAVTTSPYSVAWNTTTATNAAHTLGAMATDTAGNKIMSASIAVTVDNIPPSTPGHLTGTALSLSEIQLTWTTSTDSIGVAGYHVSRGGCCWAPPRGSSISTRDWPPRPSIPTASPRSMRWEMYPHQPPFRQPPRLLPIPPYSLEYRLLTLLVRAR